MRINESIPMCVQELSLSGSISLGECSRSTAYRWTKNINTYLEKDRADWRVQVNPSDLSIQVISQ